MGNHSEQLKYSEPALFVPGITEETTRELSRALTAAELVVGQLTERDLHITTVESCTGGALSDMITSISGASSVLRDSFVTYSNDAKIALGVPEEVIDWYSVYSNETAIAMAHAGIDRSVNADIGVGITGSLSRVDPANQAASVPGEAYIGLVYGDSVVTKKVIVPEMHRFQAKLLIAFYALQATSSIIAR